MFKHTVTYEDFNGNERSETLYFNFSKPELLKMNRRDNGNYIEKLNEVVESEDPDKIIESFTELLLDAYGEKSSDGTKFVKSQEIRDSFEQSIAFETILFDMIENEEVADAFMKGILPKDLAQKALA